ncbi:transglutaminase domain-containing protein [Enterococcus sp. 669A]|uniref:Transglutaminase domain-containing protein n=1 Tax=Candidatus Enterococcus moelleringii TaxID=2815325 RepID=A0ABS3L941_9ENTE|nr:transglutaminase domain-containing protein [Enterococcus sp. 669A]MBO1305610.1 transglutaminase domain-containing protein [Enterococcus sp. 669A]
MPMAPLEKKTPLVLLSAISISVVFLQFLSVYYLPISWVPVVLIALICAIIGYFQENWFKIILCSLLYFLGLYHFMPLNQPLSLNWLTSFLQQFVFQFQQMRAGSAAVVSEMVALPLLLALLMLLAVLMVQFERFLLSYVLMISYLLMLTVFNTINLSLQITIVFACALLSSLFAIRKLPKELLLLLTSLTVLASMAAYFLPQTVMRNQLTAVTSPVRDYLNRRGLYRAIQEMTTSAISRTGFSENDQNLGGPLLDDDTILFEATQNSRSYWRVESKDYYTGKGWENSDVGQSVMRSRRFTVATEDAPQLSYASPETSQVHFFNHGIYVPLPYGSNALTITEGSTGFVQLPENGRLNFVDSNNGEKELRNRWAQPDYQVEDLQNIPVTQPTDTVVDYFQLPPNLPDRVAALAAEVTQGQTSVIGQVTAVEEYLKNSGTFRYSKVDAVVPEENQDYVDHFLFDSQVGYCDNFSSSMVVMLRTLGIPARWTKGFAPGDARQTSGDTTVYTVRNSHAHSWVEVYFEGYGWLPFEPTPSFANPDRPAEETAASSSEATADSSETSNSSSSSSSSETAPSEEDEEISTLTNNNWRQNLRLILQLIVAVAVVIAGFWLRKYWLRLQVRFWQTSSKQPLRRNYSIFLKQAEKVLPRKASEPLSDYAQRFETDQPQFAGKFIALTADYEALIYGQQAEGQDDPQLMEDLLHLFEDIKTPRQR